MVEALSIKVNNMKLATSLISVESKHLPISSIRVICDNLSNLNRGANKSIGGSSSPWKTRWWGSRVFHLHRRDTSSNKGSQHLIKWISNKVLTKLWGSGMMRASNRTFRLHQEVRLHHPSLLRKQASGPNTSRSNSRESNNKEIMHLHKRAVKTIIANKKWSTGGTTRTISARSIDWTSLISLIIRI